MAIELSTVDFEKERHPVPSDKINQYQALIDRSLAILRLRLPTLQDRATSNADVMTVLRGVVFDMVQRATGSLDPSASAPIESQSTGAFSVSYAQPTRDVYVLDKELDLLSPTVSSGASRPRTISTPPAGWSTRRRW